MGSEREGKKSFLTKKFFGIQPGRLLELDPLKICIIYLAFGVLWIIFSDRLSLSLSTSQENLILISSIKGVLFVIVTMVLLFLLIRYFARHLREKNQELGTAYGQLATREDELRSQCDALAQSKAEWETTFNAISDWICLISPDGQIIRTNKAVESLLGIPHEQVTGRNCFELVHGTACPIDRCPRLRMLVSGKRESVEIQRQDGKGWLLITVDPVTNSTGEVVSAVHLVRDITEHAREQKALELAKKKLNLLNYVTFNDIRNMVFTLWGYQQFIKERVTESAVSSVIGKQEVILQKISKSLKFAQAYQDLGLKPSKWQDLGQVFLMAISHLDFLKIRHTVRLDGLEIFADPLLEQVMLILADNILTHGKTATQVTFRYVEGPDSLTLFFEDDGVGIPESQKADIFSPDFPKTKAVGLFLAREILEITGITLREIGEPGKGARFEMIVPKEAYRFAGPSSKKQSGR
ncbi:MAG: PAS domain-containing protein [Methanoregula sp.]|uniref:PAS domain-containing protein n=2 Tax=Methanoregula sp. TaxID=2052170 RepID=UPI003C487142